MVTDHYLQKDLSFFCKLQNVTETGFIFEVFSGSHLIDHLNYQYLAIFDDRVQTKCTNVESDDSQILVPFPRSYLDKPQVGVFLTGFHRPTPGDLDLIIEIEGLFHNEQGVLLNTYKEGSKTTGFCLIAAPENTIQSRNISSLTIESMESLNLDALNQQTVPIFFGIQQMLSSGSVLSVDFEIGKKKHRRQAKLPEGGITDLTITILGVITEQSFACDQETCLKNFFQIENGDSSEVEIIDEIEVALDIENSEDEALIEADRLLQEVIGEDSNEEDDTKTPLQNANIESTLKNTILLSKHQEGNTGNVQVTTIDLSSFMENGDTTELSAVEQDQVDDTNKYQYYIADEQDQHLDEQLENAEKEQDTQLNQQDNLQTEDPMSQAEDLFDQLDQNELQVDLGQEEGNEYQKKISLDISRLEVADDAQSDQVDNSQQQDQLLQDDQQNTEEMKLNDQKAEQEAELGNSNMNDNDINDEADLESNIQNQLITQTSEVSEQQQQLTANLQQENNNNDYDITNLDENNVNQNYVTDVQSENKGNEEQNNEQGAVDDYSQNQKDYGEWKEDVVKLDYKAEETQETQQTRPDSELTGDELNAQADALFSDPQMTKDVQNDVQEAANDLETETNVQDSELTTVQPLDMQNDASQAQIPEDQPNQNEVPILNISPEEQQNLLYQADNLSVQPSDFQDGVDQQNQKQEIINEDIHYDQVVEQVHLAPNLQEELPSQLEEGQDEVNKLSQDPEENQQTNFEPEQANNQQTLEEIEPETQQETVQLEPEINQDSIEEIQTDDQQQVNEQVSINSEVGNQNPDEQENTQSFSLVGENGANQGVKYVYDRQGQQTLTIYTTKADQQAGSEVQEDDEYDNNIDESQNTQNRVNQGVDDSQKNQLTDGQISDFKEKFILDNKQEDKQEEIENNEQTIDTKTQPVQEVPKSQALQVDPTPLDVVQQQEVQQDTKIDEKDANLYNDLSEFQTKLQNSERIDTTEKNDYQNVSQVKAQTIDELSFEFQDDDDDSDDLPQFSSSEKPNLEKGVDNALHELRLQGTRAQIPQIKTEEPFSEQPTNTHKYYDMITKGIQEDKDNQLKAALAKLPSKQNVTPKKMEQIDDTVKIQSIPKIQTPQNKPTQVEEASNDENQDEGKLINQDEVLQQLHKLMDLPAKQESKVSADQKPVVSQSTNDLIDQVQQSIKSTLQEGLEVDYQDDQDDFSDSFKWEFKQGTEKKQDDSNEKIQQVQLYPDLGVSSNDQSPLTDKLVSLQKEFSQKQQQTKYQDLLKKDITDIQLKDTFIQQKQQDDLIKQEFQKISKLEEEDLDQERSILNEENLLEKFQKKQKELLKQQNIDNIPQKTIKEVIVNEKPQQKPVQKKFGEEKVSDQVTERQHEIVQKKSKVFNPPQDPATKINKSEALIAEQYKEKEDRFEQKISTIIKHQPEEQQEIELQQLRKQLEKKQVNIEVKEKVQRKSWEEYQEERRKRKEQIFEQLKKQYLTKDDEQAAKIQFVQPQPKQGINTQTNKDVQQSPVIIKQEPVELQTESTSQTGNDGGIHKLFKVEYEFEQAYQEWAMTNRKNYKFSNQLIQSKVSALPQVIEKKNKKLSQPEASAKVVVKPIEQIQKPKKEKGLKKLQDINLDDLDEEDRKVQEKSIQDQINSFLQSTEEQKEIEVPKAEVQPTKEEKAPIKLSNDKKFANEDPFLDNYHSFMAVQTKIKNLRQRN